MLLAADVDARTDLQAEFLKKLQKCLHRNYFSYFQSTSANLKCHIKEFLKNLCDKIVWFLLFVF